MTPGEKFAILQKFERLNEKVNELLLNGATLLQTLYNVKAEVKELPSEIKRPVGDPSGG